MEDWKKRLGELSFTKGYYFKLADNGLVEKKDDQLIFNREVLESFIEQLLEERECRAREEGKREALEQIQRFVEDEMLVITRDGTDILEKYIKEWLSKLTTK